MRKTTIVLALLAASASTAALARSIDVAAGPDAQERIQSALIDAKPGDVVRLGAGRFDLTDGLSLDVSDVTVTGAGADKTLLAFDAQKGAAEGLLITSNRVTVKDFAVQNAHGNGVKAKGVDRITMKDLSVVWTGGPKSSNGAYGVYPVSSTNVLIDHVKVEGASDAGIYVGQSRNVIVRNSTAQFNVAGIEIENCYDAEVRDNLATHNAGGILVFDLPGLPQMGGHSTRVFHNASVDNDTPNFAPKGNIVAGVPTGTGVMVMANRDIHVFDNTIDGNASAGVLLVAYVQSFTDPAYNPLPREISVHGNHLGKNGFAPNFPGGPELAKALGGSLPPVVWDGVVTFTHPGGGPETTPAHFAITDGPVANLNLKTQGTAITSAQPEVTPSLGGAPLPEPAPVALPAGQGG